MLSKKQMNELRGHLERTQNPIFYYDNDADGLCSFLLLRRFLGFGQGVAVRSYPDLNGDYALKAEKIKADCIFVLDKPTLSNEFVERISKIGIPLIWIDHHDVPQNFQGDNLFIYNPSRDKKEKMPTSGIVFEVLKKKKDAWIALAGCISDCYLPTFIVEVMKEKGEMFNRTKKSAFDILYGTEFGKVVRAMNYGLKDSVSNVEKMQNFLINCKNPEEVLADGEINIRLREKTQELLMKQNKLVEEAEKNKEGKLLFFTYSGEVSMSSDLANELAYKNPKVYVCVCYKKGALTNISIRGKGVKGMLSSVLNKLENSSGGGHEMAVGARIQTKDLELFRKMFLEEVDRV
ncbi:MAG: DHH family phosphoesterase [Nanoarchaeota archaeon]